MIRNTTAFAARAGSAAVLAWLVCASKGCTAQSQAGGETAFSAVRDARMDVGSMHIAWIDSRASSRTIDSYEQWDVRVGIGLELVGDSRDVTGFVNLVVPGHITMRPRQVLEVQHIDGRPVEVAIDLQDRYDGIPPQMTPPTLLARRVLNEGPGWSLEIGAVTVSFAEALEPGLYRMRFKDGPWHEPEGFDIDTGWQTFLIAGVADRATPLSDLPWFHLPQRGR